MYNLKPRFRMKQEYRVPTKEEFVDGFQYELLVGPNWEERVWNGAAVFNLDWKLEDRQIRVKVEEDESN